MRIMQGIFNKTMPYRDVNIHNFGLQCKCKFISIKKLEGGNGKMEFLMNPRCLEHLLIYAKWKLLNRLTKLNNLKVTYKWDYLDGKTRTIK